MKFSYFVTCLTTFFSLVIATPGYAVAAGNDNFTTTQQAQIQTIVHDYLLNNPQILPEMVQKLQNEEVDKPLSTNALKLLSASTSPVAGNPKGDVTLVEFFDYQCGYCRKMSTIIFQLLKADPNLRLVFKESPIYGPRSEFASRAALAAGQQGKYLPLYLALIKAPIPFNDGDVLSTANTVGGLDVKKMQAAMNEQAIGQELENNAQLASALNLHGTPAFVIIKTADLTNLKPGKSFLIPGAIDAANLKKLINATRQG